MKQADIISLARNNDLDMVVADEATQDGGSLDVDTGDWAIQRDLEELLFTPMYCRLYEPFWGHRFVALVQAPAGPNVLLELRREWRRLMERDYRVVAETSNVVAGENEYIFSVKSRLTGELITIRRA
jgi:hypothetical protein